jgi:hypothetical protein
LSSLSLPSSRRPKPSFKYNEDLLRLANCTTSIFGPVSVGSGGRDTCVANKPSCGISCSRIVTRGPWTRRVLSTQQMLGRRERHLARNYQHARLASIQGKRHDEVNRSFRTPCVNCFTIGHSHSWQVAGSQAFGCLVGAKPGKHSKYQGASVRTTGRSSRRIDSSAETTLIDMPYPGNDPLLRLGGSSEFLVGLYSPRRATRRANGTIAKCIAHIGIDWSIFDIL